MAGSENVKKKRRRKIMFVTLEKLITRCPGWTPLNDQHQSGKIDRFIMYRHNEEVI